MEKNLRVLQIVNDLEPPFKLVAKSYAESFSGCNVTTVVLKGARDERFSNEIYGDVYFLEFSAKSLKSLRSPLKMALFKLPIAPPCMRILITFALFKNGKG